MIKKYTALLLFLTFSLFIGISSTSISANEDETIDFVGGFSYRPEQMVLIDDSEYVYGEQVEVDELPDKVPSEYVWRRTYYKKDNNGNLSFSGYVYSPIPDAEVEGESAGIIYSYNIIE